MRSVFSTALGLFAFCVISGDVSAQDVPASASPTTIASPAPVSTPTVPWADDISYLEFNLLETGYAVNPRLSTRVRLLTAGETVINNNCIKGISPKYLQAFGGADSPCAAFIQKIFKIDPANPAALCASKGIESSECEQAYAAVGLDVISSYSSAIDEKDIDAFIEQTEPRSSLELYNQITLLIRQYQEKHDKKTKDQIDEILRTSIPASCRVVRYYVSDIRAQVTTPTPARQGESKSFDAVLEELNNPNKGKATVQGTQPNRYRLVSAQCLNLVNSLKDFDPENFMYVCVRQGPFSPQCLKAKKRAQAQKKLEPGSVLPQADSIQPF